jgi:pyruvate,water dikinase
VILPGAAARCARPATDPRRRALGAEVAVWLRRLGATRVAVRSSATVEDRPGRSAAGLFHTALDVPATPAAVLRAAAACQASLRAPHVTAYLGSRARAARMAVLVLPMVVGRRGVLLTRDPLLRGHLRIELERPGDQPESRAVPRAGGGLSRDMAILRRLALRAEAGLDRPLELEFALGPEGPVLLQARPAPPRCPRPRLLGLTRAARRLDLTLDAEHNPEPLSPAHASLVARLARLALPGRPFVVGGYLYAASERGDAGTRGWGPALAPLWRRLRRAWARAHAAAAARPARPVAAAVASFVAFYRQYAGLLGPALRRARRRAAAALSPGGAAHLAAAVRTETTRRDEALWRYAHLPSRRQPTALRSLLRRYGAVAPAWDVAAPTWVEDRRPLHAAARALAAEPRGPEARRAVAARRAAALMRIASPAERRAAVLARVAAAVAEDDDLDFARALAEVRRGLLARGARLCAAGRLDRVDEVFLLPLDVPRGDLRQAVRRARAALARQRRSVPPTRILGGIPQWNAPAGALRGVGTGGRGVGPSWRHEGGAPRDVPRGAVLVCRTFLPAWSFLLPRLAGLLVEEGGALCHGAVLACEYGVPAVFGARGALARVRGGERLVVDGDAGRAYRVTVRRSRPARVYGLPGRTGSGPGPVRNR